jgi:hypothetical protein
MLVIDNQCWNQIIWSVLGEVFRNINEVYGGRGVYAHHVPYLLLGVA